MTDFTPYAGAAGGLLIAAGWQALFLLGLLAGTFITVLLGGFDPETIAFPGNPATTIIGGLLVGLGTVLGSGCTSGHGICGVARLSERSIVATMIFMGVAVSVVFLTRHVMGG